MTEDKQNKPKDKMGANPISIDPWTLILYAVFVLGGLLYKYHHEQTVKHHFNIIPVAEQVAPNIGKAEYQNYLRAKEILLQAMTTSERDDYHIAVEKIRRNSATQNDLESLGILIDRVTNRLKDPEKKMVKTFFSVNRKKYGVQIQTQLQQ